MFLSILSQLSQSKDYGLKYEDVFSDCKTLGVAAFGTTLSKGDVFCSTGNVLMASNVSFKGQAAIAKLDGDGKASWEKTDEVTDPLAVLEKYYVDDGDIAVLPGPFWRITVDEPARFQFHYVEPSFKVKVDNNATKITSGIRSIVSTKKSDSVDINYKKTSKEIIATSLDVFQGVDLTFKYEREEYADFYIPEAISTETVLHNEKSGTIGTAKSIQLYSSVSAIDTAKAYANGKIKTSWDATTTISWEEAPKSSEDSDKFLFPEFTATLSTKGGIFTKDDIDTKYPSGLAWWIILIIVLVIVIVIVIIVVVVIIICKKKKGGKVGGEKSPDPEPKE